MAQAWFRIESMPTGRRPVHRMTALLAGTLLWVLASQVVGCNDSEQGDRDASARRREIEQARVLETRARMTKLRNGLEIYRMSMAQYPSEGQGGLDALIRPPDSADEALRAHWNGPYAEQASMVDAWGRPIRYRLIEDVESGRPVMTVHLLSAGPDGEMDTKDDIQSPEPTDESNA